MFEVTQKLLDRFWSKVDKTSSPSGCWSWTAGKFKSGYGKFRVYDKIYYAHRVAYLLSNNQNLKKLCVLHKCDNPNCVNPSHLFLGTQKDNMVDKAEKNRSAKGENHGYAKLTEEQVLEIRAKYALGNITYSKLCRVYEVSNALIYQVINRKLWKHI